MRLHLQPGLAGVEVAFVRLRAEGVGQSHQASVLRRVGGYPCVQLLLLCLGHALVSQVAGQQVVDVFVLFHGQWQFTRMDNTMAPMAVIRKGFSAA